jgi:hypothetical protein
MRKLPFVIAPKAEPIKVTVGNEEIGTLELPRINDLSPSDRLFIREASKDLPNLQREAVKIAKSIKTQRPLKQATQVSDPAEFVAIAARAMGVTEVALNEMLESGEVIADELLPNFAKQLQIEFATTEPVPPVEMGLAEIYSALIASDTELLGEFLPEILDYQDVLQRLIDERPAIMATAMLKRVDPEWTLEDTMNSVSSKMLSEINQFALKEENGWTEKPAVEAEPLTDQKLGE